MRQGLPSLSQSSLDGWDEGELDKQNDEMDTRTVGWSDGGKGREMDGPCVATKLNEYKISLARFLLLFYHFFRRILFPFSVFRSPWLYFE